MSKPRSVFPRDVSIITGERAAGVCTSPPTVVHDVTCLPSSLCWIPPCVDDQLVRVMAEGTINEFGDSEPPLLPRISLVDII